MRYYHKECKKSNLIFTFKIKLSLVYGYRGSSIIGTSITTILAIPGFIKNSKLFDYLDFLLIIPRSTRIDYLELFLALVIPIIEDLLYTKKWQEKFFEMSHYLHIQRVLE